MAGGGLTSVTWLATVVVPLRRLLGTLVEEQHRPRRHRRARHRRPPRTRMRSRPSWPGRRSPALARRGLHAACAASAATARAEGRGRAGHGWPGQHERNSGAARVSRGADRRWSMKRHVVRARARGRPGQRRGGGGPRPARRRGPRAPRGRARHQPLVVAPMRRAFRDDHRPDGGAPHPGPGMVRRAALRPSTCDGQRRHVDGRSISLARRSP